MEASSSSPSSPPGNADSTFSSIKQEVISTPSSPSESSSPLGVKSKGEESRIGREQSLVRMARLGASQTQEQRGAACKPEHYVAADSNSSSTKSFVPCKVCGDKASGYHYGVTSCEGCKGFFRRSIQKQIEYRCLRDGKCLVIRLNRNRCQYCRFKKCLAVGMSRDSVRYGRVPKRSRERSTEDITMVTTTGEADHTIDETKQLAIYDTILAVKHAHTGNCGYIEENTRSLIRKPIILPPASPQDSEVASSTAESMEMERCWLWQQFAANITPSIQRVVEFAKRVPEFSHLHQDDQLILIKTGFMEIWLGHVAKLTSDTSLMFEDGTTVTRHQLEIMYDAEFVSSLLEFANSFNALSLNDTEIGLFSAIVLFTADRPGVADTKRIENHQDKLIEALKVQVNRNHANEPQLFSNILIQLPELHNLGVKHTAHLNWYKRNWTKLTLPPLFAEIFDIPKTEIDLH